MVNLVNAIRFGIDYKAFVFTFISMIVFPITFFFVSRGKIYCYNLISDYFQNKLNWNIDKSNTYSAIIAILTIYFIIVSYVVYYFSEDFRQVFCKKRSEKLEKIN